MDAETQRALAGIGTAAPDGPAGTAVRAYLAEQSRAFLTQNAAPDRLCAACRRTRSVLAVCRKLVDPVWADDLGAEVERAVGVLAAERDADAVRRRLLAPVEAWIAEGRYPDGGAARTRTLLARMLDRDRSAAHTSATAVQAGPRFHALADRMATLARDVPLTPAADLDGAEVLPGVLADAYEDLVRKTAALPEPLDSEADEADRQWFAAYQAAESARHTAELCRLADVSLPGRDPDDVLEGLVRISRALRDQHDAVRSAAYVHRAADTPRIAASTGYVLGRLHEEQRLAVLRARWSAPWDVVRTPYGARGAAIGARA